MRAVTGLIALGLPVLLPDATPTYGFLSQCTAPKLFISGDHDEFAPRELLESVFQRAPQPKRLIWIAGADHFFHSTQESPEHKAQTHADGDARMASRDLAALTTCVNGYS